MFQTAYVDRDEWRDEPVRHRYVHGGFDGTQTRFSLYLPPKAQYERRFFQYITPVPINEYLSQGATGEDDRIGFSIDSGAYFVETNGGGTRALAEDSSIAAYRANAAAAQYSRVVAMQMYGCERPYGYAFGGSGGGFRTIGGMENTQGVWDGAVPYVIGSPMAMPNVFTVRMYALRVLKDKLPAIADAVDAGSETELANLLSEAEYGAFEEVTKMGFPRQAWYIHDKLDLHGYAALFPGVMAADPGYFKEDFWNTPGYEGFDPPESLQAAKVVQRTSISNLILAQDAEHAGLKGFYSETAPKGLADDAWKAMLSKSSGVVPIAIELNGLPQKDLVGAEAIVMSGAATGARLLISRSYKDFIFVGEDKAGTLSKLKPGDEVEINNLNYLASQTYHRHQVPKEGYPVYDQFRDENGEPIYPQRPMLLGPLITASAAGSVPGGKFKGRMIVLSNLHDTEAYPWQGDWYLQQAKAHFGADFDEHIRLWYTDRAAHGDQSAQAMPTQTVSYLGVLQQALRDVSAWVEKGVPPPASSRYSIIDGQVVVPATAAERKGIQPVVSLSANGAERAEVSVGEPVSFVARIETPPGTGKIVAADWDFDGSGRFAEPAGLAPNASAMQVQASRSFPEPGTYFVTLRAAAQREGDADTPFAQVRNLARVRVVVRPER